MGRKVEQQLFAQAQESFRQDYEGYCGMGILPEDMGRFMAFFSDSLDPNDHESLDYGYIYDELTYTEQFSAEHATAIWEIGEWAATISRYNEVEPQTFVWGYNLYAFIISQSELGALPDYGSATIMADPSVADRSAEEAVQYLSAEAETNTRLLFDIAEDLLDGVVEVHNNRIDYEDDDSEFERDEIRRERLLVMRAGIGLAYKHCLESIKSV